MDNNYLRATFKYLFCSCCFHISFIKGIYNSTVQLPSEVIRSKTRTKENGKSIFKVSYVTFKLNETANNFIEENKR